MIGEPIPWATRCRIPPKGFSTPKYSKQIPGGDTCTSRKIVGCLIGYVEGVLGLNATDTLPAVPPLAGRDV